MKREELIEQIVDQLYYHDGHHKGKKRAQGNGIGFVLHYLQKNEDVTAKILQQQMEVSMPRITAIINSLEEKQLVERNVSQVDRRKIIISLTDKAKASLQERENKRYRDVEKLVDEVGLEDAETFLKVLTKANEIM